MESRETEQRLEEMEQNVESLVAMVSELYEKVHRVERVLIDEGTIEVPEAEIDEHGPDGLFNDAKNFVRETGRCSVSLLQKQYKITYKRAFSLLDTLEVAGVIAPYRDGPERTVNQ